MKCHVIKTPVGIFAFDEKMKLIGSYMFPNDPEKAAQEFTRQLPREFLNDLHAKNYNEISTIPVQIQIYELMKENVSDLDKFLVDFGIAFSRINMKSLIRKDMVLIQAINALDDINKTVNLFTLRIKEWFGLHYPEYNVTDNLLIGSIIEHGNRQNFPKFKKSSGVDLDENDIDTVISFANTIRNLEGEKKVLERYVSHTCEEIIPNFSSLIEPLLAARILSHAGSLEKLAKMTSSTIQLLGAEKALFRHLKKRGKSPKYGLIYHSSYIQKSSDDKKGKVARILSAKLMIAARTDFYSKRDVRKKLKEDLENTILKLSITA